MTMSWDKYQELVKENMEKIYSDIVIDHAINVDRQR